MSDDKIFILFASAAMHCPLGPATLFNTPTHHHHNRQSLESFLHNSGDFIPITHNVIKISHNVKVRDILHSLHNSEDFIQISYNVIWVIV